MGSVSQSLRSRIAFRCLAILFGLCIVLAIEGGLRLTHWGRIRDIGDPFVGFHDTIPLFVLNEANSTYEIPESRRAFFQPDSFAATKGKSEFRIFCLGGSTVQGRPYSIETSFTTWLELTLQAADSSHDWRVVNCGGVSYASYRLVPIMVELLNHSPDLFIVYTGHNEFLEERTYGEIKRQPRWIKGLHHYATRSRIYGVSQQLLTSRAPSETSDLNAEVDALLDYQGGLAKYHRDDEWRDDVIQHYEHNLRRMVHIARDAGIPLLLINPVSNIRDTPPFKVEVSENLIGESRAEFDRLWETAKVSGWEDLSAKQELIKQVLVMDERHAEAHFLMAKVQEAMGNLTAARSHYLVAKDEDICPLRMLESMHAALVDVARQTRTPLIDIRQIFEAQAEHGIPGDDLLIDHVHPRIEGHQRIAEEVFEHLCSRGIVHPRPNWRAQQKELFATNYKELADNYFPESVERLRGLQRWSQGRVTRLRLE